MNKKSIALLTTSLLTVFTFSNFNTRYNAKAQTVTPKTSAPKYTSFENAKDLGLTSKGEAFQPKNLPQSNRPDKGKGTRGVIGWDDRIPMLSRDYPWSAIGRVQGFDRGGKGYHCTGTLISSDVVLTNAHCVIDPKTRQFSQKILFLPNVINAEVKNQSDVAQVEGVIYGTDFSGSPLENQTNDWALLKLNKPIGLKYGYLGWKTLPSSTLMKNRNKYVFVGYSGDFPDNNRKGYEFFTAGQGWTASVHQGCSIVQEEQNRLLHDCDTTGGASGGAIIAVIGGKPQIVALHHAGLKQNGRGIVNFAVKIDFLDRFSSR
ncbi:MAG: trypsin-like serine peptidase [Mastigocoleus sp.]